jgi:hypothetical protein
MVGRLVKDSLTATIDNVLRLYPGAYPANLFKNSSKCRELKVRVIESLDSERGEPRPELTQGVLPI